MKRPTALIVEDEPALAMWLEERLEELWPELSIVGNAVNGPQAIDMLDDLTPDVAFMDIQLPGCNGIEVVAEASHQSEVVFLTAFDNHAIPAFELGAHDYLLKPVEDKPLLRAISRLKTRLEKSANNTTQEHQAFGSIAPATESHLQWIQASNGDTIEFVPVDQVEAFISREKSTYCWANQKQYLLRSNLKDLEDRLNNDKFWRIHRNAIVSVSAIDKVKRDSFGLSVWLKGYMRPLHVSRPHAWRFRAL